MKHPLHPAIVHFPIATWSLATVADLAGIWLGAPAWRFAEYLLAIGVVTGIVAVATGFIELIKIDMDSPLYRRANRHMMLATTTWCCYAASLSVGFEANATRSPGVFGLCLSAVGFGMLCLTGFLGGKLVYEHGLGVQGRTLLGPSRTAQRKS